MEMVEHNGHFVEVKETRIGCHRRKVFYSRIFHEDTDGPIHLIDDYKETGEDALEVAKKWIDEKVNGNG
jgi:hypothetical protein